jgi:hypothetical protein
MDHPSTRLLARYALGEITDDAELDAFEEHLLSCEDCRRKAVAVDLIGTVPVEGNDQLPLHIAAGSGEMPVALCGEDGSRNIISEILLPGLDASVVCPRCLALLRSGSCQKTQGVN